MATFMSQNTLPLCSTRLLTVLTMLFVGALPVVRGNAVEDRAKREAMPLWRTIPAATEDELTVSAGIPGDDQFRTWTVSHGDAGSRRYSALDQINRENVDQLEVAWIYRSQDGALNADGWRGIQTNPIEVNGKLFVPTAGRAMVALDAGTGRELWRYQFEQRPNLALMDAPARRGLVHWEGDATHLPRIVFSCGKWLYALDPDTGRLVEDFGVEGRVSLPTGGTAAGVIWRDTIIITGLRGDVFAFDLGSGRQLWRFHTIPKPDEFGGDTWQGEERRGSSSWGGVCVDEPRGIIYVAVGAPHPNFTGMERLGDNLFSNCVLALDAATGRYLWHFQNVRHDLWDLDNPAPPNLVTIRHKGRWVDAVACVTKTGSTLLLDRVSGKPIFPFRLRRAPSSTLPGEVTSPYQPDPVLPEPFSSPEFKLDYVTDRTPEARAAVLAQVERASFGWYLPAAEGQPMLYRSSRGGAEWTGASIDVPTGRLYVSANHIVTKVAIYRLDEMDSKDEETASPGRTTFLQFCAPCHGPDRKGVGMVPPLLGLRLRMNEEELLAILAEGKGSVMPPAAPEVMANPQPLVDYLLRRSQPNVSAKADESATESAPEFVSGGLSFLKDPDGYPGVKAPWGTLNCLDLNTGKLLWRVPLGEYEELKKQGYPNSGTENFGGPMVTAGGLVFCAGTKDEKIRAFDKDTGEELWSAKLPWGGYAPPATYEVAGRQYVVIAATGGGKPDTSIGDAWVAFALPDKVDLKQKPRE